MVYRLKNVRYLVRGEERSCNFVPVKNTGFSEKGLIQTIELSVSAIIVLSHFVLS